MLMNTLFDGKSFVKCGSIDFASAGVAIVNVLSAFVPSSVVVASVVEPHPTSNVAIKATANKIASNFFMFLPLILPKLIELLFKSRLN